MFESGGGRPAGTNFGLTAGDLQTILILAYFRLAASSGFFYYSDSYLINPVTARDKTGNQTK